MSWIFGCVSKKMGESSNLKHFHPEPILQFNSSKFYLAAGGNLNTLTYCDKEELKFVISGVVFNKQFSEKMSSLSWENQIRNNDTNHLNGHYAGIFIKGNTLEIVTDEFGLREIFIHETSETIYFSTRLDWLCRAISAKISFSALSTRWLLINQISNNSIIENVIRLNKGSRATIFNNRINVLHKDWQPEKIGTISPEEYSEKLNKIIKTASNSCSKLSLSLSGGLDSRVIFSAMLSSGITNWDCHSFGNKNDPDVKIAEKICHEFGINHEIIDYEINTQDNLIDRFYEYVGMTYLNDSISTASKLFVYNYEFPVATMLIDGGWGEIWRREFLYRIYLKGKNILCSPEVFVNQLRMNRADIFSKEIGELMERNLLEQFNSLVEELPEIEDYSFENWLDIFALKTRGCNFYGAEQSRLDNFQVSFMPFMQQFLMGDLLKISLSERKNGRMFKNYIRKGSSSLGKFNLVKGHIYYPFRLNSASKRIYCRINEKIKTNSISLKDDNPLHAIKEFVLDTVNSTSTQSSPYYDYQKVQKSVTDYYSGTKENERFVDWFITFEMFRQMVE